MLSYCKLFHSNALPMTKNALEIKHRKFRLIFLERLVFKKRKSVGQQQNTHWKQAQKPFCCVDDDACLETCPRHRVSSSAKVHTHTHIHTHECMVWLIVAQAAIFLWNNDEKQRAGRNGPFTQQRNAYMRMAMLRFHFA